MNDIESGLSLKTTGRQEVDEVPYGLYVWECSDGEILGDGDGNFMNVFCMKNDRKAIEALRQAAIGYGYGDGKPVWWGGKRRITDEELEEQESRARLGLTPDPLDYGAIKDEMRAAKKYGGA